MNLRRTLVPAVLVAAAALTSCGGDDSGSGSSADEPASSQGVTDAASEPASESPSQGDSPSDSAGLVEACDLLTTDQVAEAVGSPVKEGIPTTGPAVTGGDFSTCLWQSDDPDNPADTATITIYPNADAADSAREDDSQDVSGIGDRAFTGSFASVWVYVGKQSFFAQWYAFSGSDEESMPKSQALAKAVVDAL